MNRIILVIISLSVAIASAQEHIRPSLETTYSAWREAMIRKDHSAWQRVTAEHRRVEVKNRILSEKLPYPLAIFDLPAVPPSLNCLKFLEAYQNGATAKACYFGKIDFAIEAEPTENLLILSFIKGNSGWLYDRAEFVNLSALPAVRKELAAGNLKYIKEVSAVKSDGMIPPTPIAINRPMYIAKAYVFCPGREVKLQINKVSRHEFINAKEAEIIIGGVQDGSNEIQYTIKKISGATGKEVMTIRVYVMSEINGEKPLKVFEYQIAAGESPKSSGTSQFVIDKSVAAKILTNK